MDVEALEKLAALKEKGILTPEEFESMKKEIISGRSIAPQQAIRQTQPQMQPDAQTITFYSPNPVPYRSYNLPSISMWHYFVECITDKAFDFNGRARRKEYWGYSLFYTLLVFLIEVILFILGAGENVISSFSIIQQLTFLIPSLAVTTRRLHDCDISGKWLLLPISAFVCYGILLVTIDNISTSSQHIQFFCVTSLLIFAISSLLLSIFICFIRSDMKLNRYGPIPYGMLPDR